MLVLRYLRAVSCISLQIFRNQDEGLQWMVECTKLHPKMHVAHLGHLFYVLFVHHPDTAKEFFGSGCVVCVLLCTCVRTCMWVCTYLCMLMRVVGISRSSALMFLLFVDLRMTGFVN